MNVSLPVQRALKLSHVLGQMSAKSSKIILPTKEKETHILTSLSPVHVCKGQFAQYMCNIVPCNMHCYDKPAT